MEREMTFNEWLNDQKYRNDPIGDLANDASQDTNFPDIESVDQFISYIEELPFIDKETILASVEEAWKEYESN